MYRLEPQDYVKNKFISLWSLLAFQAGFINSIGFLACQRYVSHVTGFGSQVGIALAKQNYWVALEMVNAPMSFILGAWLCGYLTIARKSRGLRPRYDIATLLIPALILGLLIAANRGAFGTFGEHFQLGEDFLFMSVLLFICGLQNATFATLTKGQIRTTHLTGISTDFGTDLALILSGQLPLEERKQLKRKNFMRAMTFISFSVGALISALLDSKLQYWSLGVPFMTSLVVSGIFVVVKYEIDHLNNVPNMALK